MRTVRRRLYASVTRFGGTMPGRRVAASVASLNRAFLNDSANHESNGEDWLLARLAPLRPVTVFDVGANHGNWSTAALREFPDAEVHAFEPQPVAHAELLARVGGSNRLIANQLALTSLTDETVTMHVGADDTLSSIQRWFDSPATAIRVPASTSDAYCAQAGVECIDILKVDAEGHDLEVLRGFSELLTRRAVGVVQFEQTLCSVASRVWRRDFYDLLGPLGYSIGQLFPTWVEWRQYDPVDERFLRHNFVAVRPGTEAAVRLGLSTSAHRPASSSTSGQ